jgi:hypothetical protein
MTKFKNKYRIESTRLPHWDYNNPGMNQNWKIFGITSETILCIGKRTGILFIKITKHLLMNSLN